MFYKGAFPKIFFGGYPPNPPLGGNPPNPPFINIVNHIRDGFYNIFVKIAGFVK